MKGQSNSELVIPIRDAVWSALRARAVLHGVEVLKREPKQLQSEIEAAIAQLKLCLFVFPAVLLDPNENNPGPYFDRIEIRVRCIENPILNDTVLDAHQLMEIVHQLLNGLTLIGLPGLNSLSGTKPGSVPVEDDQNVIWDVIYKTSGGLTPRPDSP